MENPFETYKPKLFPRVERAGAFIGRLVHFLPDTPLASHGDHPRVSDAELVRAEASDY